MAITSTNPNFNYLLSGKSWSGLAATAPLSAVKYSLNAENPSENFTFLPYNLSINNLTSFEPNANLIERLLNNWSSYANIDFELDPANADMFFAKGDMESSYHTVEQATGYTFINASGDALTKSQIFISNNYTSPEVALIYSLNHEIGSAIGLRPYKFERPTFTWDKSVMTYHEGLYSGNGTAPITPMLDDVAAVQFLYGVNNDYNAGDNIYELQGLGKAYVIWDAGGSDTISVQTYNSFNGEGVSLNLNEGEVNKAGREFFWLAVPVEGVSEATGADIENAIGSLYGDTIIGNEFNNFLDGWDGDDILYGWDGADRIYGSAGNDIINGGNKNDFLFGEVGSDTIAGGFGSDTLLGGEGNDRFIITSFAEVGATPTTQDYILDFSQTEGDKIDISGLPGTYIFRGDGEFVSDASLQLRYFHDFYKTIIEIDDEDYDVYPDSVILLEGIHNLKLSDFIGATIIGTIRNGGVDGDSLIGSDGADTLIGGLGNDTIYSGIGRDYLSGEEDNDILYGQDGADTVYGGTGNDTINGGANNDLLHGDDGNDIIAGSFGADTIYGGAGNDRIIYVATSESGIGATARDIIADFSQTDGDKIDISGFTGVYLFRDTSAFVNDTSYQLRYYFDGGNTIIEIDDNDTDTTTDLEIELSGNISLVSSDFVL